MKKWYIEFTTSDGRKLNGIIYEDLKTIKGVINRLRKITPFTVNNIINFKIYNYIEFTDKDSYTLAKESKKGEELFEDILNSQLYD